MRLIVILTMLALLGFSTSGGSAKASFGRVSPQTSGPTSTPTDPLNPGHCKGCPHSNFEKLKSPIPPR